MVNRNKATTKTARILFRFMVVTPSSYKTTTFLPDQQFSSHQQPRQRLQRLGCALIKSTAYLML